MIKSNPESLINILIDLDCKYTDVVIQFVAFKNNHVAACDPKKDPIVILNVMNTLKGCLN